MSWEERFFGTAPAALTAQVEGRQVRRRFPAIFEAQGSSFQSDDVRVLDFRFIHGVAGPDGPGLLLSFSLRGAIPEGSIAVFDPLFGGAYLPAQLPEFGNDRGMIVIANDIYGADRAWSTKLFLPFTAVKDVRVGELTCRFRLYQENGVRFHEFTKTVPWPEAGFRDAMNAMSFTVHLLVSLMKGSGGLSPLDIQTIRRDLKRRYALTEIGLKILKRYLKDASKDPSTAQELGLLAREGKIFSPHDQDDILENLIRFANVSSGISNEQQAYILEFAKHAGFQSANPFEESQDEDSHWTSQQNPHDALRSTDGKLLDAYRTLDLSPDATASETKKRFRHLVREVHPDRLQHASEDIQRLANERLAEINQAYEVIRENLAHF